MVDSAQPFQGQAVDGVRHCLWDVADSADGMADDVGLHSSTTQPVVPASCPVCVRAEMSRYNRR